MPDPRVVYVVAAVVVLALVVWVVVVLVRPASEPQASLLGTPAKPSTSPAPETERTTKASTSHAENVSSAPPEANAEVREALRRSRPRLSSHLEIQDQPDDDKDGDAKS